MTFFRQIVANRDNLTKLTYVDLLLDVESVVLEFGRPDDDPATSHFRPLMRSETFSPW